MLTPQVGMVCPDHLGSGHHLWGVGRAEPSLTFFSAPSPAHLYKVQIYPLPFRHLGQCNWLDCAVGVAPGCGVALDGGLWPQSVQVNAHHTLQGEGGTSGMSAGETCPLRSPVKAFTQLHGYIDATPVQGEAKVWGS